MRGSGGVGAGRSSAAARCVRCVVLSITHPPPLSLSRSDFGKSGEDSKKGKKKSKSSKDDAAAAPRARVISDDEMPPATKKSSKGGKGARDDDDDDDDDRKGGIADALSNIDLSTPLGDDEVLPTRAHRSVADPAAARAAGARKGAGRARVLVASDDAPAPSKKDGAFMPRGGWGGAQRQDAPSVAKRGKRAR